ncbi:hypothetical protein TrLO_g835 [Triparma laevis f. longispina]|uniref:Uncharacterized protein n=1 Tax=Triparma laevis f. longispina TaxID=1714387 RepID=A0A9W6ZY16_9STRA|nr:hypothetical protein TrLO_g835 [Triparma laevis f. longispina]
MKIYKNGVLVGTETDGWEPSVLTLTHLTIGAYRGTTYFLDSTIAYLKIWNGVELQQSNVTDLYAPHNNAHHFWDFRGCTTGSPVTDSIVTNLVIIFPVYEKCKAYFGENNKVQLIMFSILLVVNLVNYILARVLYSRTYTIIMLCLMIGFLEYFCYKNRVKIME